MQYSLFHCFVYLIIYTYSLIYMYKGIRYFCYKVMNNIFIILTIDLYIHNIDYVVNVLFDYDDPNVGKALDIYEG